LNLTERFVSYLIQFSRRGLKDETARQVKDCLTDYLGGLIAGCARNREKFGAFCEYLEHGSCFVLGTDIKTSAHQAAFWNGFHSHICELDDGHHYGIIHLGAPVFSALFAYMELTRVSEHLFWKAAVTGYEAALKLARAMQPAHRTRGYHATGTCGCVGAAVAVAVLQGQNAAQLTGTLSAAMTGAAGLLEVIKDPSEFKPYNAGRAAADGLNAALFGSLDYIPPGDILGGERGFFKTLADNVGTDQFISSLAGFEQDEILTIYRKPYAACRYCHAAIECALLLRESLPDISRIKSVTVYTYETAVVGHDHNRVSGHSSAKMSIPYGVASALCFGAVSILEYDESHINDPRVRSLLPRIVVAQRKDLTECRDKMPAELEIELQDGTKLSRRVDYPKGEPENPMTPEEINAKAVSLFRYAGMSDQAAKRVLAAVQANELRSISHLMKGSKS